MKVVLDLDELAGLSREHQSATEELAGLTRDLHRRASDGLVETVARYGIPVVNVLSERETLLNALQADTISLERSAMDIERQLARADLATGTGSLAGLSATFPDLWWFGATAPPADGPLVSTAPATPGPQTPADIQQRVVSSAEAWIGTPYQWGGGHGVLIPPHAGGVDCSGLVNEVFGANGMNLHGGTAADMYHLGHSVANIASAQPGDLLFFGRPAHHVAIYVGNGNMIEAPHTGALVRLTPVRLAGDFSGIRRLTDQSTAA